MTCEIVKMKDGTPAILCSHTRRAPKCSVCGRPSSKQCDFPTRSRSGTCDKFLCDKCAVPFGDDTDFCPSHPRSPGEPVKQGSLF